MSESNTPADDALSQQTIMDIVSAYQKSRILLTAYELDVFTLLGDDSKTPDEVAKKAGTDIRAMDRLMNALCAIGLLEKKEGRFSNTPLTSRFLVKGKATFMANLMHSSNQWKSWSTLTEAVRCGTSVAKSRIEEREGQWFGAFISAMHWRGSQQASELVSNLDLTGVSQVLDVGGGSGVYAMAIAKAREDIEAVVLDLPDVIPLTKYHICREGLTHKVRAIVGDYEKDDLGSGFDLVLLSAVVHINSPAANNTLFRKCFQALNPNGQIVISDFIMDESRTHPARGALFALNMLVATAAGDTYTEGEMRSWLEEVGFCEISRRDLSSGASLIIGRKRPA
ncbi:MAG: methyltransferase [Candidatus Latescibacteria bacterium]|nr:methyltransferase [Candidatus Latescibacterota bacterium]NIM64524.1 methyltransferase [Candidatus Latescibacterota bacterium]NIO00677.1 methyltransferase [Candidatus Latescibacterota bacterium]NIO27080.1 methyltransferase [Candidatus Latescibacterota bacterium]NIO54604.1 methyltransferase [Candidatus Latescibacterota bacterium]